MYLYETDIVDPGLKFNLDDVKVETFNDGRAFSVAANLQRVAVLGRETMLSQSAILQTDDSHTSLLLTARTKEPNIFDARKTCVESLDGVVTLLGNIYHPTIFDKKIYTGWDYTNPSLLFAESSVFLSEKVHQIDPALVTRIYNGLIGLEVQYDKMAKLYAQAASMPMSEEKFVKLWTILEIFPLETSPGKPLELAKLYELLTAVVGLSKSQIERKLKIHSKIYARYRSEIVHTGSTGFSEIELKDTTARLDAIVRVVMRKMLGLEYEDELTEFM